jgi:uncharacterized protein YjdB
VATVSGLGLLTARAVGTATITATTADGTKSRSFELTVFAPATDVIIVNIPDGNSMVRNQTRQLNVEVTPNTANQAVTWSSSNTTITTVSGSGLLTARAVGTATITATTADGTKSRSFELTVFAPLASVTIGNRPPGDALTVSQTRQLTATVTPDNANPVVTWSSDNETVATVSETGLLAAVSAGAATITATSGDGTQSSSFELTVFAPAADVNITGNPPDDTLVTGQTRQLSATVSPGNANPAVTWSSDNQSIATVSSSGLLTAVSTGTAIIAITSADGTRSNSFTLTVFAPATGVTITGNPQNDTLVAGQTRQLTATVNPSNANPAVTWSSDNETVATVSETGLLTAVSAGTATIAATSGDGTQSSSFELTVFAPAADVIIDSIPDGNSMVRNQTRQLSAEVTPNTANQAVTWSSSNTTIATVSSSGLLTARAVGTAIITATTADGTKSSSFTLTVYAPLTSVTIGNRPPGDALTVPQTRQLSRTINPSNANPVVTWSSNNETVATVSGTGLLTAVSAGTATITITSADETRSNSFTLTVFAPATGVTITGNPPDNTLAARQTRQLGATVTPGNANQAVTWSSNNQSIATVSGSGLLTARAVGTVDITATTADGTQSNTFTLTVHASAVSVQSTVNPAILMVPVSGAVEAIISAVVRDSNGDIMTGDDITYSLPDSPVGVTIDSETGVITVLPNAVRGSVRIIATGSTVTGNAYLNLNSATGVKLIHPGGPGNTSATAWAFDNYLDYYRVLPTSSGSHLYELRVNVPDHMYRLTMTLPTGTQGSVNVRNDDMTIMQTIQPFSGTHTENILLSNGRFFIEIVNAGSAIGSGSYRLQMRPITVGYFRAPGGQRVERGGSHQNVLLINGVPANPMNYRNSFRETRQDRPGFGANVTYTVTPTTNFFVHSVDAVGRLENTPRGIFENVVRVDVSGVWATGPGGINMPINDRTTFFYDISTGNWIHTTDTGFHGPDEWAIFRSVDVYSLVPTNPINQAIPPSGLYVDTANEILRGATNLMEYSWGTTWVRFTGSEPNIAELITAAGSSGRNLFVRYRHTDRAYTASQSIAIFIPARF